MWWKTINYFVTDIRSNFNHFNLIIGHHLMFCVLLLLLRTPENALARDITTNDQMCPDPILNGNREERMFFINHNLRVMSMPVGDIVKGREGLQEDIPCSFIDTTNIGRSGLLKVEIRAAQFSFHQWNFTNSTGDCRSFIKFRMNEKAVSNATQLCRLYKIFSSENGLVENMTSPPSIWLNPNNKLGFSVPAPSSVDTSSKANETVANRPLYLQIVYKIHYSMPSCVINVQQYAINKNAQSKECDGSIMRHQLCTSYSCSDQHKILKKLGFLPYDVVVDMDNLLGRYLNDKNNLKKWDYELMKNYDIERRDGDYYFKPKRNYHAALFSGMTRAISFLFVLSILISCISYQLRPYLRPSSSFESEFHDRSHESHRRCYRRPNSHPILPCTRPSSSDVGPLDTNGVRVHRPRRYFHNRGVGAAPPPNDLPLFNNPVVLEQPPSYEMIDVQQPPSYAETMNHTVPPPRTNNNNDNDNVEPQIIPTDNASHNNNPNNNNNSNK